MSAEEARQTAEKLLKQREAIEAEIKKENAILSGNGVGLRGKLTDAEDYPIQSIDVHNVRAARQNIIRLTNDYNDITKQMEKEMEKYWHYKSTSDSSNSNPVPNVIHTERHYNTPFIKITQVMPDSPATLAGLHDGDEISEFGSVHSSNFKDVSSVAAIVQHSENKPINVRLKRGDNYLNVRLVPQKWDGKGLLGCNIEILK